MQNEGRLVRLRQLIHEAESLSREELRIEHNERRLARLSAALWICRDVVDELVESNVIQVSPPEGRPNREHF